MKTLFTSRWIRISLPLVMVSLILFYTMPVANAYWKVGGLKIPSSTKDLKEVARKNDPTPQLKQGVKDLGDLLTPPKKVRDKFKMPKDINGRFKMPKSYDEFSKAWQINAENAEKYWDKATLDYHKALQKGKNDAKKIGDKIQRLSSGISLDLHETISLADMNFEFTDSRKLPVPTSKGMNVEFENYREGDATIFGKLEMEDLRIRIDWTPTAGYKVSLLGAINSDIKAKVRLAGKNTIRVPLWGYDVDWEKLKVGIGIFAIVEATGNVTIEASLVDTLNFNSGLQGNTNLYCPTSSKVFDNTTNTIKTDLVVTGKVHGRAGVSAMANVIIDGNIFAVMLEGFAGITYSGFFDKNELYVVGYPTFEISGFYAYDFGILGKEPDKSFKIGGPDTKNAIYFSTKRKASYGLLELVHFGGEYETMDGDPIPQSIIEDSREKPYTGDPNDDGTGGTGEPDITDDEEDGLVSSIKGLNSDLAQSLVVPKWIEERAVAPKNHTQMVDIWSKSPNPAIDGFDSATKTYHTDLMRKKADAGNISNNVDQITKANFGAAVDQVFTLADMSFSTEGETIQEKPIQGGIEFLFRNYQKNNSSLFGKLIIKNPRIHLKSSASNGYAAVFYGEVESDLRTMSELSNYSKEVIPLIELKVEMGKFMGKLVIAANFETNNATRLETSLRESMTVEMGVKGNTNMFLPTTYESINNNGINTFDTKVFTNSATSGKAGLLVTGDLVIDGKSYNVHTDTLGVSQFDCKVDNTALNVTSYPYITTNGNLKYYYDFGPLWHPNGENTFINNSSTKYSAPGSDYMTDFLDDYKIYHDLSIKFLYLSMSKYVDPLI